MGKKALCLIFAFLLSIENFGAIVSSSDGGAFVTKQEFEDLKSDFNKQIDKYNDSIDNKIDGIIASFLAGRRLEQQEIVKTGFTIQGDHNTMEFFGKNKIIAGSDNEVYTESNVFLFIVSGYSAVDWWHEDTQHTLSLLATWNDGDKTNAIFEKDGNYITTLYKNIQVISRSAGTGFGASTGVFHYGGLWASVQLRIPEPSEDDLKGNHVSNVWPFERTIQAYGFENYKNHRTSERSWPNHSDDIGYRADMGHSCVWWSDPIDCTAAVTCAEASYTCNWIPESKGTLHCHWPWGINNTMRVKQIIRDSGGNVTEKSHYRFVNDETYTNTKIVNSRTGSAIGLNRGDDVAATWPLTIEDTTGYVAYLNTNLENIGDYYYQEIKDIENIDEKLSHGFYICSNERKEGYLELVLQSDTDNTKIFFSKDEFSSSIDTAKYLDCEIYNYATNNWESTKSPNLISKSSQYKIRVNFDSSAKKIYLAVAGSGNDINNFNIKLSQIGDAILSAS